MTNRYKKFAQRETKDGRYQLVSIGDDGYIYKYGEQAKKFKNAFSKNYPIIN